MRRKTIAGIGLPGLALLLTLSGCEFYWLDANSDLTFQLTWDDENTDLDLFATYPDPTVDSVTAGSVPPYVSIQTAYEAPVAGNAGFFPEDGTGNRASVSQDFPQSADRNVKHRIPESRRDLELIDVLDIPFGYPDTFTTTDYTSPTSDNALPTGYTYAWVGVMEIYVYGERGTVSGAGNVEVEIYDSDDRLIASIPIDEDTYIKGLSVARIPVFRTDTDRNYYQILLDKRLMTDKTGIRSLAAPDSDYVVLGSFGGDE